MKYLLLMIVCIVTVIETTSANDIQTQTEKHLFIYGGDINLKFVQYVVDLTEKENPKICYLPTASADNNDNLKYWENICQTIKIDTLILKTWVSSSDDNKSFEEILLTSDAIVVGGGNTLNMLGIWKAQGIDTLLIKAYDRGIVLSGGSAGSICWFQNGISDSRPVNLSIVDGLGLLPYSNCPHYSQESRKELYHQMLMEQKMVSGYACDELSGILFKNGKVVDIVSQSDKDNSYFVSAENGEIKATLMKPRILLMKNALPEGSYAEEVIGGKIRELSENNGLIKPLDAYIKEITALRINKENIKETDRTAALNIKIEKVFVYQDKIAGIVNDAYLSSFGYGLWYFYNCDGVWTSMGEDIGGATVFESEIKFREKAEKILQQAKVKLECK